MTSVLSIDTAAATTTTVATDTADTDTITAATTTDTTTAATTTTNTNSTATNYHHHHHINIQHHTTTVIRERGGICYGILYCCIISNTNQHVITNQYSSSTMKANSNRFFHNMNHLLFRSSNNTPSTKTNITTTSLSLFSNTVSIPIYCILIGTIMIGYESYMSYINGDTPIHIWNIIGASIYISPNILVQQSKSKSQSKSQVSSSSSSNSFRFITNQGTQVYCYTSSSNSSSSSVSSNSTTIAVEDCTTWLSCIQMNLTISSSSSSSSSSSIPQDLVPAVMPVVPPILPKVNGSTSENGSTSPTSSSSSFTNNNNTSISPSSSSTSMIRYCRVCGVLAPSNVSNVMDIASLLLLQDTSNNNNNNNNNNNMNPTDQQVVLEQHYIPLIQYGIEDKYGPIHDNGPASPVNHNNINNRRGSTSSNNNNTSNSMLYHHSNYYNSSSSTSTSTATTGNQYYRTNQYYICQYCCIAQGVVQYIQLLRNIYYYNEMERRICIQLYTNICSYIVLQKQNNNSSSLEEVEKVNNTNNSNNNNNNNDNDGTTTTSTDANDGENNVVVSDTDTSNGDVVVTEDTVPIAAAATTITRDEVVEDDNDRITRLIRDYIIHNDQQQSSSSSLSSMIQQCGSLYYVIYNIFLPGYIDGNELLDCIEDMIRMGNTTGTNDKIVEDEHSTEVIDDITNIRQSIYNHSSTTSTTTPTMNATKLKLQAFQNCAGDMGTAMKLLVEQAIPSTSTSTTNSSNKNSTQQHNDDMLSNYDNQQENNIDLFRCVLEFLLDLCTAENSHQNTTTTSTRIPDSISYDETGTTNNNNLTSIAFFWPQLCHIHLRMLPATNAVSLARIDLMEDFLLTISTQYSIHLALELVWSHTADLEESLQISSCSISNDKSTSGSSTSGGQTMTNTTDTTLSSTANISSACRRRRFAVIRFLCELESLLFDFDGGWGGGSVTLGKMFVPTPHQVHIMKVAMSYIQQYRVGINPDVLEGTDSSSSNNKRPMRYKSRCLSKSARWDKLIRDYEISNNQNNNGEIVPKLLAEEKLRIAKNADYFSSHLIFSKRLADIAEKLRFLDVSDRASALEEELNLLNASGIMGGDPINRIRDHLIRVVRVPSTESHVFRSKERTPVLLLMEIIDEKKNDTTASTNQSNTSKIYATNKSNEEPAVVIEKEITQDDNVVSSTGQPTSETDTILVKAESFSEDIDDVPKPPSITPHTPNILEGSSEGSVRLSPGPKALKRFDPDNEALGIPNPTTPKHAVQKIVSNAAEEQLRDIVLPKLDHMPHLPSDSNADVNEKVNTGNTDVSDTTSKDTKNVSVASLPGNPTSTSTFKKRNDMDDSISGRASVRKISTLTTVKTESDSYSVDVRRAVLTTIMMLGLQGNTIAAGAADSVQWSLKELERKRATELLLSDDSNDDHGMYSADSNGSDGTATTEIEQTTRQKLLALGITSSTNSLEEVELASRPTEEDEVLEAIRLMLIQNQVAQGKLSPSDAAKVLQHTSLVPINESIDETTITESTKSSTTELHETDEKDVAASPKVRNNNSHSKGSAREYPVIDAGDVDRRLVGCGPLPPAVLQALTLWRGGVVSHAELLELVKKDIEFVKHSILVDAENLNMLQENSAFWGRFAFGERWAEKKSRIGSSSPQSSVPGWDLLGVIVKSNDDLRQEAFIMQLIELCQEAFELADLELWINPYRILATGRTTGVIECVRNAMSFDALKKRPGYGKGGLREHLQRMTEFTADPGGSFKSAQQNFVRSLAAYSLLSYIFQFKDRHNGNLLLDTAGHVIHIDFGFVFGIAPGGSFSLEMSTPFKLTEEMLDVMGGLRSPLFSEFVTLFCCGYLALQRHCDTFTTLVEITSRDSTFKCFNGRDTEDIVAKLRERFNPDLSKEETIAFALDLIKQSTTSYGTRQYDLYQYLSQGIY